MVIGLEVHAQLLTTTKLFGGASTAFGASPNSQVDAVSLGLPGALPVLNREAVRLAAIAGFATGCTVHPRSIFARKNYFYADLPKGYQISQFDRPICTEGLVNVRVDGEDQPVRLTRIHMEEDAGKSSHGALGSLVDLNRAGVPLIEIVSEPDIRSPEQAVAYLKELRAILMYAGVNDGSLEQGSFRCDANVSVRRIGQSALGTRCELKNLNSFRGIRDAIIFEANRQVRRIEAGEAVIQQTRLWNVDRGRTEAMRGKEQAHDYRYVPDPDLPPLLISDAQLTAWQNDVPELPASRRDRYAQELQLDEEAVWFLCEEPERARRYEAMLANERAPKRAKSVASFLTARISGALNRTERTWSEVDAVLPALAEVHDQWRQGLLSNKMLSEILSETFDGDSPLADRLTSARARVGVIEQDTEALQNTISAVLAAHPTQLAAYRGGKQQLFGFFMGQVMKAMKGKANAKDASASLRTALNADD